MKSKNLGIHTLAYIRKANHHNDCISQSDRAKANLLMRRLRNAMYIRLTAHIRTLYDPDKDIRYSRRVTESSIKIDKCQ